MTTPPPQPHLGDAFGAALLAALDGGGSPAVYERDDGFVEADGTDYFAPPGGARDEWVLDRCVGRVLDLGAGAGRAALTLQERAVDVVALDVSAGCVEVCRRRGVRSTFFGTIGDLALDVASVGTFDTVACFGNNLGLIGSEADATPFFAALDRVVSPGGALVGTCLDPLRTTDSVHLDYHQRNRAAGRLPGSVRLRTRYRHLATDWFGLLWMTLDQLADLARPHGWHVVDTWTDDSPLYAAALTRH